MPPRVENASSAPSRSGEPERDDELSRRFCPPVHYVVEIKSVTELLKLDTYESGVFEAGGYEWSLRLKPNGDGKEYMSMYLSIEEPDKLGDSGRVLVDYKFFVFDNILGQYVTFKEKGKELRAFSKAKPQWGLSKFLSLASFNNEKNGYRLGDSCIFGAEVLVSKRERKKETLTINIIRDLPDKKIIMAIRQFSASNENPQCSGVFTLEERTWKLQVFPQRHGDRKGNSLSVYLQAQKLPPRIKMYVKAKLSVLNNNDHKNDKKKIVNGWLSANNDSCGHQDFMSWEDLCKPNGGFVSNKELGIKVQILVISQVKRTDERV